MGRDAIDPRTAPSKVVLATVASLCGDGLWPGALAQLAQAREVLLFPDERTFGGLINSCGRLQAWQVGSFPKLGCVLPYLKQNVHAVTPKRVLNLKRPRHLCNSLQPLLTSQSLQTKSCLEQQ